MPDKITKRSRLWTLQFITLFLIGTSASVSLFLFLNVISLDLKRIFGNTSYTGLLSMAFCIMAILFRFAGALSDRFGRRRFLVAGLLLFSFSALGFGFFPYLAALILFRGMQGAGYAMAHTVNMAAAADISPKERLTEAVSYMGLGYALSQAISGQLASAMSKNSNYSNVYIFSSVLLVLAAVGAFFVKYENKGESPLKKSHNEKLEYAEGSSHYSGIRKFIEPRALPVALCQLIIQSGYSLVYSFMLFYAIEAGFENAGLFFTLTAATMIAVRAFCGKLVNRYSTLTLLIPPLAIGIAGYFIIAFTNNVVLFYAVGVSFGFMTGMTSPVLQALAIKLSPSDRRGAASGTYGMAADLANGVGVLIWGIVLDYSSFKTTFASAGTCIFIGGIMIILFFNKIRLAKRERNNT